MPCKFSRGDAVRLNDHGLEQIFGSVEGFKFMLTKEYEILETAGTPVAEVGDMYEVTVNDAALNKLLIDDKCFDLVRPAETFFSDVKGIDEKRAALVAEEACGAFWAFVASRYPEAKTGDLDPGIVSLFEEIAKKSVSAWAVNNVPEPEPAAGDIAYSW